MTTIAWDGKTVAADSRATQGNRILKHAVQKIWRCEPEPTCINHSVPFLYSVTGNYAWRDHWLSWYLAGADPEKTPFTRAKADDVGCFIVIHPNEPMKCYSYEDPYPDIFPLHQAWGSGSCYAMGAMDAGANAVLAVEIAIGRDVYSGGPIDAWNVATASRITTLWPVQPQEPFRREVGASVRYYPERDVDPERN